MTHLYRDKMDRVTMWRQRLDASTKWAMTIIAGILVYGVSQSGIPHAVLPGDDDSSIVQPSHKYSDE